jgi:Flp pilus assembly pilin Flp
MLQLFKRLRADDRGVTVIEYAVLASLIIVGAITAITLVGTNLNTVMASISGAL